MNTKGKHKERIYRQQLIEHLRSATDDASLEKALDDLLTPSELTEISKRLQIFKLLQAGIPQRQIAEELGVGIATVTRGSRALQRNQ